MTVPSGPPTRDPLPSDTPFDLDETDRLLATTRSVRKRLDLTRAVEPAVLLDCLRLACQAPTASNTQNWRWVVVTDAAKRAALADLYREVGGAYLHQRAESGLVGQDKRVYDSAAWLADHLHEVPVHVVPCILGRPQGRSDEGLAAFYGSIVPAAWSFMLALRSRGLGSAWTTLHLRKEKEAAALLGIPDDVTQVALLPVAYTVGTDFRPAARPPVQEISFWDSWGSEPPAG